MLNVEQLKAAQATFGVDLTITELAFIAEYLKDLNQRRAAKASGHKSDQGNEMLADERIQAALRHIFTHRLNKSVIDAEWLINELVDNHYLARHDGKLSASNTALIAIGKLAAVDAFAAEKVQTVTSNDVIERLKRGRDRAAGKTTVDDVSFF